MLHAPRRPLTVARRQHRPLRCLALCGMASAALVMAATAPRCRGPLVRGSMDAFVATLAPVVSEPAVRELPWAARTVTVEPRTRTKTKTEAAEDAEGTEDEESSKNSTDFNITLQLGTGYPDDGYSRFDMGPPWVMCHVQYADRNSRDEHGSVTPRTVLEEWVMKGSSEHVSAFKTWRQQTLDVDSAMRCHSTTQKAVEEVKCLVCVPRGSAGFPLTPTGHLSETNPGPLSNTYVLTIGGVDQCLASSSSSFCKSGSVAVSM
uniref:Uncharacterized protein n=1 Tax=Alexandrium catenella TaxID=2925 RepID=A0A7S1MC25_ALECA